MNFNRQSLFLTFPSKKRTQPSSDLNHLTWQMPEQKVGCYHQPWEKSFSAWMCSTCFLDMEPIECPFHFLRERLGQFPNSKPSCWRKCWVGETKILILTEPFSLGAGKCPGHGSICTCTHTHFFRKERICKQTFRALSGCLQTPKTVLARNRQQRKTGDLSVLWEKKRQFSLQISRSYRLRWHIRQLLTLGLFSESAGPTG